jgi:hypothetical protein
LRTRKSFSAGEDFGGLLDRLWHGGLADGLHIDAIDVTGQMRGQFVRIRRIGIDPVELGLRLAGSGNAEHFALRRSEGDHDQIVLIAAPRRLPLGLEHADHPQRHALDLDEGADRQLRWAEQLRGDRFADDGDQRGGRHVGLGDGTAHLNAPIGHRRIVGADALDLGAPVLIAVLHLS